MARSQRLRLRDVRAVFRLLGEIRELGADPLAWRRHMLASLDRVIGSPVGSSSEGVYTAGVPITVPESNVYVGVLSARDRQMLTRFAASLAAARCPVFRLITRRHPGGRTGNYGRGRVEPPFDDRTWYGSDTIVCRREAGIDDFLYSRQSLPWGRAAHFISLNRLPGDPSFTDGQAQLLHILHQELARLWRGPEDRQRAVLPPRLRQVVELLCEGNSEKQIAAKLKLSRHTVHNYLKELHRRFSVASRGELLARLAAAQRPDFFPRLSTPPPVRVRPTSAEL
jgi:DNA-binding CsgD family transcriptional regulator